MCPQLSLMLSLCYRQICNLWRRRRSQHSGAPDIRGSVVKDSRPLKAPLVDVKQPNDALKLTARNREGELIPYQPRPPLIPRQTKSKRSGSVEETVRNRRLRNSQESLSDPAETGSSTDSLKEDQTGPNPGGFIVSSAAAVRNQDSGARPLSASSTGSPVFRERGSSLSDYERRPHSQQSDPTDQRARSTKGRLSPVQPTGPLPALEKGFVSATLKAANRIDRDCLDYAVLAREKLGERLHRNLSDSRLLENMGSDSASVNSMRSTYSVLSPIRPQDVRNRYRGRTRGGFRWSLLQAGCAAFFLQFILSGVRAFLETGFLPRLPKLLV